MTIHEMEAVTRVGICNALYGEKDSLVLVTTTKDGKKLYMGNGFVEDKRRAFPFRYTTDGVATQIMQVAMQVGVVLDVEPYEGRK
jgi:hypothetical protein